MEHLVVTGKCHREQRPSTNQPQKDLRFGNLPQRRRFPFIEHDGQRRSLAPHQVAMAPHREVAGPPTQLLQGRGLGTEMGCAVERAGGRFEWLGHGRQRSLPTAWQVADRPWGKKR